MKTILIVDGDVGFLLWLGWALSEAGYLAFPATSREEALLRIVESAVPIHLLIINPAIAASEELARSLQQQGIRSLAALDATDESTSNRLSADASMPKPMDPDDEAKEEWLRMIRDIVSREPVTN